MKQVFNNHIIGDYSQWYKSYIKSKKLAQINEMKLKDTFDKYEVSETVITNYRELSERYEEKNEQSKIEYQQARAEKDARIEKWVNDGISK